MKIKLTLPDAKVPYRANPTDAGADLYSPISKYILAGDYATIDLGIQMELPKGRVGLIVARSGLGTKDGIRPRNCLGVIDEKYRGNVKITLENSSNTYKVIDKGDRIAQLLVVPVDYVDFEVVDELDMSDDRGGGFGHTGK